MFSTVAELAWSGSASLWRGCRARRTSTGSESSTQMSAPYVSLTSYDADNKRLNLFPACHKVSLLSLLPVSAEVSLTTEHHCLENFFQAESQKEVQLLKYFIKYFSPAEFFEIFHFAKRAIDWETGSKLGDGIWLMSQWWNYSLI